MVTVIDQGDCMREVGRFNTFSRAILTNPSSEVRQLLMALKRVLIGTTQVLYTLHTPEDVCVVE